MRPRKKSLFSWPHCGRGSSMKTPFTTEELSSFKTVGDLLSSIEKKLGEKK
jgi:hypothetical protein